MAKIHDCRKCKLYETCTDVDKCRNRVVMTAIQRAGDPIREHRPDITYMHDLAELDNKRLDSVVYGDTTQ